MRARMALSYAGIDFQHREILLKDKPQSMLDYSPKGTVPVLIIGERIIDESIDIMHWALQQQDNDSWLKQPKQPELIELCDNKFKAQLDRYKYSDRYDLTEIEYRQKTLWFLSLLDDRLAQFNNLFSNDISLADIALFPFIRQFAYVNKTWFDDSCYTHLKNWLNKHLNSKLFQQIMAKHKLWSDD